jgi:riboflavin synthase
MFTGIVQAVGKIESLHDHGGDRRITLHTRDLDLTGVDVGDSVCVSGVCLTASMVGDHQIAADLSAETLSRTTFARLRIGDHVNLEKALTPQTPLGGHLVMGHVDGVGKIVERRPDGRSVLFSIETPAALVKYIAEKGSICVDGVSLTVNAVAARTFNVNIIPHTLRCTTLDRLIVGCYVNLEVDLIARYLERLLQGEQHETASPMITRGFLAEHGFTGKS